MLFKELSLQNVLSLLPVHLCGTLYLQLSNLTLTLLLLNANLKVTCFVLTPLINAYLYEKESYSVSSRYSLKWWNLSLFWRQLSQQQLHQEQDESDVRSVPDLKVPYGRNFRGTEGLVLLVII